MDGATGCSPQPAAAESLLLAKLIPSRSPELACKSGCETWSVAFSPDGLYFAWSQGHNIVKLIPWPLEDPKISYKSTHRLKADGSAKGQCGERIIDCGQIVWGLSFGTCPSENANQSPENQHKCLGTILATGLTNGEIKLWKVPTGKTTCGISEHGPVLS